MRYSIHYRCADPEGRDCPRLWRADGSWNPRHGSALWAARIPTSKGTSLVKRAGYKSKTAARAGVEQAGKLLDLAADDATRRKIGDLIVSAKHGAPLPALDDVRRRLGLGRDPGDQGVTAGEWLETWLAGKQRTRRASTVRGYETHIRVHIIPVIGDLPLDRLNPGHVEDVLAAVPGSAATRQRVLATLRAALNAAVKQRRITWNPCIGTELEPGEKPEAKTWTPAQAQQFIDYTVADPLGLAFRIALLTGPRRGDLLGLRWSGADLDNGMLTVEHTLLQLGGKITEGKPKTKAGERRIYLGPGTAALLREHRQAQLRARMQAGPAWQDNDLVFARPDGSPWPPDWVSRRFRQLAVQADLPPIKLHEARHSAISAMRQAGVDADLRMRVVGHASEDVHARYTHYWDTALRQAAGDAERLVTGS